MVVFQHDVFHVQQKTSRLIEVKMMTFVTWDSFVSFLCNSINVCDSILNCQFFFKHEIRRIETRSQAARVSDRNRCKKPDEISEKFDRVLVRKYRDKYKI